MITHSSLICFYYNVPKLRDFNGFQLQIREFTLLLILYISTVLDIKERESLSICEAAWYVLNTSEPRCTNHSTTQCGYVTIFCYISCAAHSWYVEFFCSRVFVDEHFVIKYGVLFTYLCPVKHHQPLNHHQRHTHESHHALCPPTKQVSAAFRCCLKNSYYLLPLWITF